MSAFKWFAFAIGIPLSAVIIGFMMEIARPMTDYARDHSTSAASATGLDWYTAILNWLPLLVLFLLGFMVVVAIVVRRDRTVGGI